MLILPMSTSKGQSKDATQHFWAVFLFSLFAVTVVRGDGLQFPRRVCHETSLLQGPPSFNEDASNTSTSLGYSRIVVVGDVHGALPSLLSVLQEANIVDFSECRWAQKARKVLLIQMGDVVDRGPEALESWQCLQTLQIEAGAFESRVVRLLGNHELLYLQGETHYRNLKHDTPDKIATIVAEMKREISEGKVLASFSISAAKNQALFFSHAGIRPQLLKQLRARADDPSGISDFVNEKLRTDVARCLVGRCSFRDEIYGIGPERGGSEVGGLFWTDFSVLQRAASEQLRTNGGEVWPVIQIVGHTLEISKVRATDGLLSVCVDVGLYLGGQGYLEIHDTGHFWMHEKQKLVAPSRAAWTHRDATKEMCSALENQK